MSLCFYALSSHYVAVGWSHFSSYVFTRLVTLILASLYCNIRIKISNECFRLSYFLVCLNYSSLTILILMVLKILIVVFKWIRLYFLFYCFTDFFNVCSVIWFLKLSFILMYIKNHCEFKKSICFMKKTVIYFANISFGRQVIRKAVKLCGCCSLLYSLNFQLPCYLWVPAHVIGLPFVDINQKFIVWKSQPDLQCATASAEAFQSTRHMLPATPAYKWSDTVINLAQLTLGKVKRRGLQRRHKWTEGNEAKIQLK